MWYIDPANRISIKLVRLLQPAATGMPEAQAHAAAAVQQDVPVVSHAYCIVINIMTES